METTKIEYDPKFDSELDKVLNHINAESITDWLIKFHGAREDRRETIVSNLKSSFRAEFVKGQLKPMFPRNIEVRIFGLLVFQIKLRVRDESSPESPGKHP